MGPPRKRPGAWTTPAGLGMGVQNAAGELVTGHRIVIAELGLVPYAGKVVRDPGLFEGRWSKPRRAAHVLARLGSRGTTISAWENCLDAVEAIGTLQAEDRTRAHTLARWYGGAS